MKIADIHRLSKLELRERALLGKFCDERNFRINVVHEFQARGIGKDIGPDQVWKWVGIILKSLTLFVQIAILLCGEKNAGVRPVRYAGPGGVPSE